MPFHDALVVAAVVCAFAVFGLTLFTLERTERKALRRRAATTETRHATNDVAARRAA